MNTFEMTKIVGALCGALLVLLLIQSAAVGIYDVSGAEDEPAFPILLADAEPVEEEPVEEVDFATLMASADAGAGESLFRQCQACHKVEAGANGIGPYLHGVVGRDIAAVDGFGYSDALAGVDGDWTPEALSGFLEAPASWAPGTAMAYNGMRDAEDRANLIAYLDSLDD